MERHGRCLLQSTCWGRSSEITDSRKNPHVHSLWSSWKTSTTRVCWGDKRAWHKQSMRLLGHTDDKLLTWAAEEQREVLCWTWKNWSGMWRSEQPWLDHEMIFQEHERMDRVENNQWIGKKRVSGDLVDFQRSPPPNSRLIHPTGRKLIKSSKKPACMNKELLTELHYKRQKQGQVTQKEYRDSVQACRDAIRITKAHLELNLVRNMKGGQKGFYKYLNSKRQKCENVGLLGMGFA